jgi:NAD-dependent deacetylase
MANIIDNEKVNLVAELIKESKYTVVLTGAGVSTGSGIADFRTPGKGIWEKVDPFKVTSITAFEENPQRFYHFYRPRIEILSRVSPNPAHKAIARLEEMGYIKCLITQNIDNLHCLDRGGKLIIVNFMSTHLDYSAEVAAKEDVCDFLPAVVEVLRRK